MSRHPAIFCEIMENRLTPRTISLLLIFAVLGVYYPAIFAPLNSVDDPGMYNYLLNTDSFTFRDIFVPGGSGTYYRPILVVSFLADKFIWGLEESFMHLENILFHMVNTLLVFAIARQVSRLLSVDSPLPALLAALFFAIHPLNTESVVWISGRTDLLAGTFILLSVYFLLWRRGSVAASFLAAVALLVACLAKDTAVFFLPAGIMLPFFPVGGVGNGKVVLVAKSALFHILIFVAAGAGYFAFRELAFNHGDLGAKQVMTHVIGSQGDGVLFNLRLVLKAAGFYVKKLFIPFPLNFGINHVSDLYIIVGLLLIVLVIRLLVHRTLAGYFLLAATAIGSSALLVPLLKMTWTPLAERYMYIPSAFFLIGITFMAYPMVRGVRPQSIVISVVACLVAVSVYSTAQRAILWQDNLALYQDCQQKSPDFVPAQNEVANALYARGRVGEACQVINSIAPPHDLVNTQYLLISKSAALVNSGDLVGAHQLLLQALQNPGKHETMIIQRILALNDYTVAQGKTAREEHYSENEKLLSRLYEISGNSFYLYRLGQTQLFHGERALARDTFRQVVAQSPQQAYYCTAARKLLEKLAD